MDATSATTDALHPESTEQPPLRSRNVVGAFATFVAADAALSKLMAMGYSKDTISIASQTPHLGTRDSHAHQGLAVGAAAGALTGGGLALVAMAIPGIGPLFLAGELIALATAALAGGTLGALVGSFAGLGMPTEHAKRYEEAVRAGSLVMTVRATSEEAAQDISRQLTEHGATEVAIYQPAL